MSSGVVWLSVPTWSSGPHRPQFFSRAAVASSSVRVTRVGVVDVDVHGHLLRGSCAVCGGRAGRRGGAEAGDEERHQSAQRRVRVAGVAPAIGHGLDAARIGHGVDHRSQQEVEPPSQLRGGSSGSRRCSAARYCRPDSSNASARMRRLNACGSVARRARSLTNTLPPNSESTVRAGRRNASITASSVSLPACLQLLQQAHPLRCDRRRAGGEDRREQLLLLAEVVVQRGEADLRHGGDVADADAVPAALGEQRLARVQQALPHRPRRLDAARLSHPAALTSMNVRIASLQISRLSSRSRQAPPMRAHERCGPATARGRP